jgi:ferritin
MRTRKGIELTLIGILIHNFQLKGEQSEMAVETAKEIIQFLHDEEKNLVIPPIESPRKWFKRIRFWLTN